MILYTQDIETRKAYVEIASRLLGLGGDATVERMTPKVMEKIDEFLKATNDCSRLPNAILLLIKKS